MTAPVRHRAIITQMDAANLCGRRFGFDGPVRIEDESVDLIVTSPPYWSLRSYTDGGEHYDGQLGSEDSPKQFIANLVECTREWMRVLKPTGSIFVNLGDKYAGSGGHNNGGVSKPRDLYGSRAVEIDKVTQQIAARRRNAPNRYLQTTDGIPKKSLMGMPWRYALECIDTLGLILRAELIWAKPNGLPESVKDRVARKHEQWFHFVKQGDYFAERRSNPRGVLPGSVWTVVSEPLRISENLGIEHFAAFPSELPKRIIQAWSPPSGVVLDPFGGTGTTALAAQELGRIGITNDLSADYCRLAEWRTSDPKQIERMRKRITAA